MSVKDSNLLPPSGGWSDRVYIVNCGAAAGISCELSNQGTIEHESINQDALQQH